MELLYDHMTTIVKQHQPIRFFLLIKINIFMDQLNKSWLILCMHVYGKICCESGRSNTKIDF